MLTQFLALFPQVNMQQFNPNQMMQQNPNAMMQQQQMQGVPGNMQQQMNVGNPQQNQQMNFIGPALLVLDHRACNNSKVV